MHKRPAVLLVDDEPLVVTTLRIHLRRILGKDWTVLCAYSGSEALAATDEHLAGGGTIPLAIVDYQMHPMKGNELLVHLNDRLPDCRKVLLTGQADLEAVAEAIDKVRLFRYMQKPWIPEDLELTVRAALEAA